MCISRRTFWSDLKNARKKIADAIVNGKAIEIKGGSYIIEGKRKFLCYSCGYVWEEEYGTGRPERCKNCGSMNIHRHPEDRMKGKFGGR